MTQEALRMALEHIEGNYTVSAEEAITAIKEALAQPEQEPVAWQFMNGSNFRKRRPDDFADLAPDALPYWKPLYTHPPQRTWVGLSEDELERLIHNFGNDPHTLLDEVDARLRSRNT